MFGLFSAGDAVDPPLLAGFPSAVDAVDPPLGLKTAVKAVDPPLLAGFSSAVDAVDPPLGLTPAVDAVGPPLVSGLALAGAIVEDPLVLDGAITVEAHLVLGTAHMKNDVTRSCVTNILILRGHSRLSPAKAMRGLSLSDRWRVYLWRNVWTLGQTAKFNGWTSCNKLERLFDCLFEVATDSAGWVN